MRITTFSFLFNWSESSNWRTQEKYLQDLSKATHWHYFILKYWYLEIRHQDNRTEKFFFRDADLLIDTGCESKLTQFSSREISRYRSIVNRQRSWSEIVFSGTASNRFRVTLHVGKILIAKFAVDNIIQFYISVQKIFVRLSRCNPVVLHHSPSSFDKKNSLHYIVTREDRITYFLLDKYNKFYFDAILYK